jgi:hypothetical protein
MVLFKIIKGAPYQIPIHPSNVVITKLKEKKDRTTKIAKIAAGINARSGKAEKKIKKLD